MNDQGERQIDFSTSQVVSYLLMLFCSLTLSYFFLCRLLNRQIEEWGDVVTVVSCDMRDWEAPEKVGVVIVVSSG